MANPISNYHLHYDAFVDDMKHRRHVAGLILAGSRARGLETGCSDTDVFIIVKDDCSTRDVNTLKREAHQQYGQLLKLDLTHQAVQSVSSFESFGQYDPSVVLARYGLVHAKLEFDKTQGLLSRSLEAKQRLTPSEKEIGVKRFFPAYLNKVYRSIQSAQIGDAFASSLDASTSIDFLVGALFTLHGRVPPYNKYLAWEVTQHPIECIDTDRLLESLDQIITTASVLHQQQLLMHLVELASSQGYRHFVDQWHGKLEHVLPAEP